ncbi:MAG: type I DNA topoisomerase [Spirochaetia bacterium]|nr:type I DNA topoisomerase [Spirochaetia bacterium]
MIEEKKNKKPVKKRNKNATLIIVESPTKIKSLSKFLGSDYRIESSKGHLIDLPKSSMGIDIAHDFSPQYITIRGKGKTLAELKRAAKSCTKILLATDPDREGEAISWHLQNALSPMNDDIQRIEFNEITQQAVLDAIAHPRAIDLLKVNSQQARRLLDRLVGYSISPILQEKFSSRRFSAGRVQSAALKIIVDREREIEAFVPVEYWEVDASWTSSSGEKSSDKIKEKDLDVKFKLAQINGKKTEIGSSAVVEKIKTDCQTLKFLVTTRKSSERKTKPSAPYVTSRLQQDASNRLGFRAQKTMSVAQSLYEGVEIPETGATGLITYMRTDSTRISQTGLEMARNYIKENFEESYLPEKAIEYGMSKTAQDAHEAIRPTDVNNTPKKLAPFLTKDQFKLYELIWSRFIASQMTNGIDELTTLEISSEQNEYLFRFSESRQVFPGFRAVFSTGDTKKGYIPSFKENDPVSLAELFTEQKFTSPPPRFNEASLIRIMEESGIGRPATYVPTIGTLDKRNYIERKGKQLKPTQIGKCVNDIMQKHFPDIVDIEFTAGIEETLDEVANGHTEWKHMLRDFFTPFELVLNKAAENIEDMSYITRIPIGRDCPKCGNPLQKKLGKNGYFIGCSHFAGGCRYSESIPVGICPLCKGNVVSKASKKGRKFYGCENYASSGCEFIMMDPPSETPCPMCSSLMSQKVRKTGIIMTCQNPECKFVLEQKNE